MVKNTSVSKKQITETGIVFALVFIIVGLYSGVDIWFPLAGGLLLVSLIFPLALKPMAYIWFILSKALGWITSRIILILVFYLLIMPVGVIRRLMGKDSLQLRSFKKEHKTAYKNRDHIFTSQDLTYPF